MSALREGTSLDAVTRAVPVQGDRKVRPHAILRAWVEATKPGIARLVTITAGLGFAMTALVEHLPLDTAVLLRGLACLLGVWLAASGANVLNQWWEASRDARMRRTATRPLPSGRLTPPGAVMLGLVLAVPGVAITAAAGGPAVGLLTLASVAVYLLVYTPLKPRTAWNTLVGAIPGALPPLIGAATALWAAPQTLPDTFLIPVSPIGLVLFALMLVWQLPHFYAIALLYSDDYRAGGFRMLPHADPSGRLTPAVILLTTLALLPTALLAIPASNALLAWPYALLATALTLWFAHAAWRLLRAPSRDNARRVFLVSIAHLPLLALAMLAEASARTFL